MDQKAKCVYSSQFREKKEGIYQEGNIRSQQEESLFKQQVDLELVETSQVFTVQHVKTEMLQLISYDKLELHILMLFLKNFIQIYI